MSMRNFIDIIRLLERFDPDQFLNRMSGVMELIRRGATEGERAAAREAFDRMMQRARDEVARMRQPDSGATTEEVERFLRRIERLKGGGTQQKERPKQEPPRERNPLFKDGQWVVMRDGLIGKVQKRYGRMRQGITTWYYDILLTNGERLDFSESDILRPATQDEIDAATAGRTKSSTASSAGGDIDIQKFARFIEPEQNSNKVYGVVQFNGNFYVFWGGFQKALKVKLYPDQFDANVQFRIKLRKGYDETDHSPYRNWLMRALKAEFAKRP